MTTGRGGEQQPQQNHHHHNHNHNNNKKKNGKAIGFWHKARDIKSNTNPMVLWRGYIAGTSQHVLQGKVSATSSEEKMLKEFVDLEKPTADIAGKWALRRVFPEIVFRFDTKP